MEPHRMLLSPKPPEMPIQIITEVIARAENQQGENPREMRRLLAIVVVDDEDIGQATHCTAHAQRAEDESPHDFVEEVVRSGHDEDANGEEDDFGKERGEPEEEKGADVDLASFLGDFNVGFAGYYGLVGVGCHCGGCDLEK